MTRGIYHKLLIGALMVQSLALALLVLPVDAANPTVFVGTPLSLTDYTVCAQNAPCPAIFPPPSEVMIVPGDSVTWVWLGGTHSVTSENGAGSLAPGACGTGDLFDSGPLGVNATFSRQFDMPGTCFYFCTVHGGGIGAETKVVVAAVSTSTAPTSTSTSTFPVTTTTTERVTTTIPVTTIPAVTTTTTRSTTSTLRSTTTTVRRCVDGTGRSDPRCLRRGGDRRGR